MTQPTAPTPPPPPGHARITLYAEGGRGRACGPHPVVTVTGQRYLGEWRAETSYDVPAGNHWVAVSPRHLTGLAPQVLELTLTPGQQVRLHYRAPNSLGFGARLTPMP